MLLFNLIGWWYGKGFLTRLRGLGQGLGKTADTFSIGLMFKTLFNPFRQIDAGTTGKEAGGALQAFLGRMMSRFIGFVMRSFMILAGGLVLILQVIGSGLVAVLHLAVPVLPVVGIVMMVVGWVPKVGLW